ncbi:MAG: retroviral-like aspartic protease family protein [Pyrinomonadaceae bacterium]
MGLIHIEGTLTGKNNNSETVEFLVDSGASYTLLPKQVWEKLELKSKKSLSFILADGTKVERGISECFIQILDDEGHTPVLLGEEGDDALLGTVTLEEFGFVLNPFSRTLQSSMKLRLA